MNHIDVWRRDALNRRPEPAFTVARREGGAFGLTVTEVFPTGIDRTGWIDMTGVGDYYAKFMAPDGKIHDCEDYAKQMWALEKAR